MNNTIVAELFNAKNIIIYGAGKYGKILYGFLEKSACNVLGFVQSQKGNTEWNGIKITTADEFFSNLSIEEKNSITVCIALYNKTAKKEIINYLKQVGIALPSQKIYDCTELIERIIYSSSLGMDTHREVKKVNTWLSAQGRFTLSKFIDNIDAYSIPRKDYTHNKIKVCITATTGTYLFWNSIETIYQAFNEDSKYEITILLADTFHDQQFDSIKNTVLGKETYSCIPEGAYNIEKEQPDILLVTFQGSNSCLFPNCQAHLHYFKLVVALTGELISYQSDSDKWNGLSGYHNYYPDYYIIDSLLYDYMHKKNFLQKNMVDMGNPKFDAIYKIMHSSAVLPDKWSKLKGKKTILWANTHGIYEGFLTYTCTFDLYAKTIFEYAKEHSDVAFIIRLHPAFLLEMKKHRFWSEDDLKKLKQFCYESNNLVWDDSVSYNDAYRFADGILTDGFCGIMLSSLPLMKPICVCYRYDMEVNPAHASFVKNLYQVHSNQELTDYFDIIRIGNDPMYEQRKSIKERYIHNFDGKNGLRIKEFIENKFSEKILSK